MLPAPMLLRMGLVPGGGSSPLGWGARIELAEVELGYNYVGLEERVMMGGFGWAQALGLVVGLCGGCSQANALALVQAVEDIAAAIVPPRAAYIRMVLAETERIASHLLNAAETMAAMGMLDREALLRDLRERSLHAIGDFAGARFHPGLIVFGGVSRDVDETACRALVIAVRHVERVLRAQARDIINSRDVAARLSGLGKINGQEAALAGLRGPVARASGIAADLRASAPSGAYEDEGVTIVVQRTGDAFARLVVRLLECLESCRVVEQALDDPPGGPVRARGSMDMGLGSVESGVGRVEGPRGEVFCWAQGNSEGVTGLHISAGSFPTLGVLPGLLRGVDLDDLRLLLLSLDLCLACAER
jgi:Ni,Fe-hydrogenase III large subunit